MSSLSTWENPWRQLRYPEVDWNGLFNNLVAIYVYVIESYNCLVWHAKAASFTIWYRKKLINFKMLEK